jgi:hypothetical protein
MDALQGAYSVQMIVYSSAAVWFDATHERLASFADSCFGKWIPHSGHKRKAEESRMPRNGRTPLWGGGRHLHPQVHFHWASHTSRVAQGGDIKNSNEAAWRFLSQYCLSPVKTVQPILSSVVSRKFGVKHSYLYGLLSWSIEPYLVHLRW